MNILKIPAAIAAAFALLSATAFGEFPEGSPAFKTDFAAAAKAAKASGKPMLVVFSATWCPPCQANKKNVYPSEQVKAYHDKFIWVYLDTDQAENATVAKQYGVRGIPHIQFVKSDGSSSIDKMVGGTDATKFAKTLKGILKKAGS